LQPATSLPSLRPIRSSLPLQPHPSLAPTSLTGIPLSPGATTALRDTSPPSLPPPSAECSLLPVRFHTTPVLVPSHLEPSTSHLTPTSESPLPVLLSLATTSLSRLTTLSLLPLPPPSGTT